MDPLAIEPITALTDFLLSVECFIFTFLIFKRAVSWQRLFWNGFFICVGMGAFLGALFHGFSFAQSVFLWRGVNLSLILGITFFPLAILSLRTRIIPKWLFALFIAILILASFFFYNSQNFLHILFYEGGVLTICIMIALTYLRKGYQEGKPLLLGMVVSVVAALAQATNMRLLFLNNNDIFHLVQIIAMVFFFKAWKINLGEIK